MVNSYGTGKPVNDAHMSFIPNLVSHSKDALASIDMPIQSFVT